MAKHICYSSCECGCKCNIIKKPPEPPTIHMEEKFKNAMKKLVFQNAWQSVHAIRILLKDAYKYDHIKDTKKFFFWEKSEFLQCFKNKNSSEIDSILSKLKESEMIKMKMQIDLYHVENYLKMLYEDPKRGIYKLNDCAQMLLVFGKIEREFKSEKLLHDKMSIKLAQTITNNLENRGSALDARLNAITMKLLSDVRIMLPIESRYLINHRKNVELMALESLKNKENSLKNSIEFYKMEMDQNIYLHANINDYLTETSQILKNQIEYWMEKYDVEFDNMEAILNIKTAKLMNLTDLFRSKRKLLEEYRVGLQKFLEKEAENERIRLEKEEEKRLKDLRLKMEKQLKKRQAAKERKKNR